MTTDQILAQCDTIRGLSEKATAAPWHVDPETKDMAAAVESENLTICISPGQSWTKNFDLIAESRTFAPSAARALKVAIEALERIRGVYGDGYEVDNIARTALQQITEAFKIPLDEQAKH